MGSSRGLTGYLTGSTSKSANVYSRPHGFTGFYPQVGPLSLAPTVSPPPPHSSNLSQDKSTLTDRQGFTSRLAWLWKQKATPIGALLTAAIGAFLIWQGSGILARFSYDVRSVFQGSPPNELVMV